MKFSPTTWFFNLRLPKANKSIAILKVDGIGDYLLQRNLINYAASQFQKENKKVTLIGNELWRDLFESLDADCYDDVEWVDLQKFEKSRVYRYHILIKLKLKRFSLLIHPTISRSYFISDFLSLTSGSSQIITISGDLSNRSKDQAKRADSGYSRIIDVQINERFEFLNYRQFWRIVLNTNHEIPITKPHIKRTLEADESTIGLFLDASEKHKRWNTNNHISLIRLLFSVRDFKIVLFGSLNVLDEANKISDAMAENNLTLTNKVGKTTPAGLIQEFQNCRLIVTNDTMATHLGASLNIDMIVLWKGDHFARYLPYPEGMNTNVHVVTPPGLSIDRGFSSTSISSTNIDLIEPDIVFKEIMDIYTNK
jgi:ADP-heptose:LPS heptosyltransferase